MSNDRKPWVNSSGKKLKKQYTHRFPGLGWEFGIPNFAIRNGFTYAIASLQDTNNKGNAINTKLDDKKIKVGKQAEQAITTVANSLKNIDDAESNIRNALDFLKRAADSERNKEIAVIQEYKSKIEEQLPDTKKGMVKKLISAASKINIDNLDQNVNNYKIYLELIREINYVKSGYEETLHRIKQLQSHRRAKESFKQYQERSPEEKKQMDLFSHLYKDDVRFIGEENITSLLGEASSSGKHTKSIFSRNFRNAIKKYGFSEEILQKFNSRGSSAHASSKQLQGALLASIGTDLLQVLQEQLNIQRAEDFINIENIDEIVKEYFDNFKNQKNLTRFQTALLQDSNELDKILDNAIRTFGIEDIEEKNDIKKRRNQIAYRDWKYDKKDENSFLNILTSRGAENLLKNFRGIKFKLKTKTSHGNFDEFLSQFVSSAINDKTIQSRTGQAIDAYAMGSATCIIDTEDFINYVNSVDDIVVQTRNRIRKAVENDQTEQLKLMNERITQAEKDLIEKIKKANQLESQLGNAFIFHESFKLSKVAEVGMTEAFKGRSMAILNYIDTIYSIPQNILTLPDKENLYFLALNLTENSGGQEARNALRDYLSIFAGLIMFEDVERMAIDINDAFTSPVKNIHLYKLNGIYVPSSMILSYSYMQMRALYGLAEKTAFSAGSNATVRITASQASEKIAEVVSWTTKHEYPNDGKAYSYHWYELANDVAAGTTVKIAFLAGFARLIDNLFQEFASKK